MMEHFVPNDSKADDSDYQKQIRQTVDTPINTPDDKEFTHLEISSILAEMDPKKAPGEDGITSAILLRVFNKSGDKQYSERNGSEEGARRRWYHKRYTPSSVQQIWR